MLSGKKKHGRILTVTEAMWACEGTEGYRERRGQREEQGQIMKQLQGCAKAFGFILKAMGVT